MRKQKYFFSATLLLLFAFSMQGCQKEPSVTKSITTKGMKVMEESSDGIFSKAITGKRQALVVGISDYKGTQADLGGIDQDVAKMKKLFEGWGFDVTVLFDKESLKIVDHLTQYAKGMGSDDFFTFYYSGHGSHKVDENGDEEDNQDETLVLSDGEENTHLIDDILFAKFNAIKAKKMIFFDSCHSGTVFRALGKKVQSKTISPDDVTRSLIVSKGISVENGDTLDKNSDYIVFSSSQDDEESLATPTGSLFTNALIEIFSESSSESKSFNEINDDLVKKVLEYARQTDGEPHHPNISFSDASLGSGSLKSFVSKKSTTSNSVVLAPTVIPTPTPTPASTSIASGGTLQDTLDSLMSGGKMDRFILDNTKSSYKSGEFVEFSLDTGGASGYLTLFYVDSSDVTLLYPNPFVQTKVIQGKYLFPKDFSGGKFDLEAYKGCGSCLEEKTVIYALLSAEPISDINRIKSKGGLTSFAKGSNESKVMIRAVRVKATPASSTNSSFKPQLGKYEFVVR